MSNIEAVISRYAKKVNKTPDKTKKVTSVTSTKMQALPLQANEIGGVTPVASVTSNKSNLETKTGFFKDNPYDPSKKPIRLPIIKCKCCKYFSRIEHPNLGHCLKGMRENVVGLWDSDRRTCEVFNDKTNSSIINGQFVV